MKKKISLFIVVVCLMISGCAGTSEPESASIIADDWEITVKSYEIVEQLDTYLGSYVPDDGVFFLLRLEVANHHKQPRTFLQQTYRSDIDNFLRILIGDTSFEPVLPRGYQDNLIGTEIPESSSTEGTLLFQIPDKTIISADSPATLAVIIQQVFYYSVL